MMSVSKTSRQRGTILDEIMQYEREQLPKVMREVPFEDVRAFASVARPTVDFFAALKQPGVSLIAECKKASPSKGLIARKYDAVNLARAYVQGGARALSVLTNARFFQGSLADLRDVKEALPHVPVLRKDFVFHPYQVYEARTAGADAILLIAAVLQDGEIAELLELARRLGMEALVEVHTESELERVLALGPRIVGVNNRNLQTFEVDFANTRRLRANIPAELVVVGESGLRTPEDVRAMAQLGVDAVLVGETLVRSKDILAATRSLVRAGQA